jgi:hypothetical protein
MTNEGFIGGAVVETPLCDLGEVDPETQAAFDSLHAQHVKVKLEPTIFALDGGSARISISVVRNEGGQIKENTISFLADNCRGGSLTAGEIEFDAELFQLPAEEWSPPDRYL